LKLTNPLKKEVKKATDIEGTTTIVMEMPEMRFMVVAPTSPKAWWLYNEILKQLPKPKHPIEEAVR
jgi:hypothetical protein